MRDIRYTSSPLLASKTPVWRSKFIVAMLALAFIVLFARAAYVQVIGNAFFQRQGEVRFARTLEMPASRGRIFDRNGLLLASSVVAPSIWAIPEDVDRDPARLRELARLLGMPDGARPVAILCIGHVEAFYPRPMLELEQWAERMPIDSVMAENAWPDAS